MPKASVTYNLETLHPTIAAQWHPTKNGDLMPRRITPGSGRKIWWRCSEGHEWQAVVASRTKGSGCPRCYQESIVKGRPMVDSGLMKEWHPSLNQGLNPRELTTAYNRKLWWICSIGHEWQATLRSRLMGEQCPNCDHHVAVTGAVKNALPSIRAYHRGSEKGFTLLDLDDLETSQSYKDTDFRQEKRYAYRAAVITENERLGNIAYALLKDFSPSGMHIETDYPIRQGEIVIIRTKEKITASTPTKFSCRVRWCRELSDDDGNTIGYRVGLQFMRR